MKRITLLLALALLTSSVVGCGCCRRLRDSLNRGAYCGTTSAVTPAYVAPAPAPVVVPQAQPMFVPQAQCAPQCVPCQPCPQPCYQPCCDPCCQPCCPTAGPCCETYGYGASDAYSDYTGAGYMGSGWTPACDGCGGVPGAVGPGPVPVNSSEVDPGPVPPGP